VTLGSQRGKMAWSGPWLPPGDQRGLAAWPGAAPAEVSPSLLAAVLLVENRALDSSAGAVGLMQVMPMHAGAMAVPPLTSA
jgi:soluble lytic murein transglycosylase-like protein